MAGVEEKGVSVAARRRRQKTAGIVARNLFRYFKIIIFLFGESQLIRVLAVQSEAEKGLRCEVLHRCRVLRSASERAHLVLLRPIRRARRLEVSEDLCVEHVLRRAILLVE